MAAPIQSIGQGRLAGVVANIVAGTRLALFRRVAREDFRYGIDQLVILLVLGTIADAVYYLVAGVSLRQLYTDLSAVMTASMLLFLFAAYVISRLQGRFFTIVPLTIVAVSAQFVIIVAVTALIAVSRLAPTAAIWMLMAVSGLHLAWMFCALFRAIELIFSTRFWRSFVLLLAFLIVGVFPIYALPQSLGWYGGQATADDSLSDSDARLAAHIYQNQVALLDTATRNLARQRPGVSDLYFVGFGGWGPEDVFLKETTAVRELFDRRFDTEGRSLVLVNNPATLWTEPLASIANLRFVLQQVAERMDVEEDMLFLFLTSHGSPDHRLAIEVRPLHLSDLPPTFLKIMLDESGIKWRVIVVSACYSGGFLDALKDDNSLVITASRADRNSFGCSNRRDFTYFGEAYFDQQLRQETSFVEAFLGARRAIEAREESEGLTPSLPQMHVGPAIAAKLQSLERRLGGSD